MITGLLVHRVAVPLVRPFVTAQRRASTHVAVIVEVRDSDGRSGWGEAPCSWRVTGESPQSVAAAVSGPLAETIRGADVVEPDAVCNAIASALVRNSAAKMAVDCAVHDLAAQTEGVPLAVHLGGGSTLHPVTTDMTLSAGEPGEVAALARAHSDDGFRTLKVKCGRGGDDRMLLRAIRDAVGDDVTLRVDANQGFSRETAIRTIRAWEDDGIGVAFVEQPVAARALDDLAAVRAAVETPIMADESVWDLWDLAEVIRRGAADMVNIKLAKSGGLTEAMRMVRQAERAGVGVLLGSMMESTVGIAAAASLALALGLADAQDLDAGLWLSESPVLGGPRYEGSSIRVPDVPGLGFTGLASR